VQASMRMSRNPVSHLRVRSLRTWGGKNIRWRSLNTISIEETGKPEQVARWQVRSGRKAIQYAGHDHKQKPPCRSRLECTLGVGRRWGGACGSIGVGGESVSRYDINKVNWGRRKLRSPT